MPADAGRPQDQGRRHTRKGAPSTATSTLLGEYQAAMRAELRAVLGELQGSGGEQLGLDGQPIIKRPALEARVRLWDLAIKLGRELGTEVDVTPAPADQAAAVAELRPRRRGRVAYGPD
jgi:hypothetical protein